MASDHITPEGPAATRCEVCGRELRAWVREPCPRTLAGDNDAAVACKAFGYVRVSARLVEVERERGEFRESLAKVGEDAFRWQAERDKAQDALAAAESRASAAESALHEIAEWILPPSGETWDDGRPMSYGAAFGSNGERDYFRNVARRALSGLPPLASETAGPEAIWPEYKVSVFNQESYPAAGLPPGGIWKLWVDEQGRRCSKAVAEIETKEDAEALAELLGRRADSEWTRYGERLAPAQPTPAALVPKEEDK